MQVQDKKKSQEKQKAKETAALASAPQGAADDSVSGADGGMATPNAPTSRVRIRRTTNPNPIQD